MYHWTGKRNRVFLGVILNENFSWKPLHTANVDRKISNSIGIIYKASFCLPSSSLLTLYYSLGYPYLVYCVSPWGSTYSSNLKRILLLQKKVVRNISGTVRSMLITSPYLSSWNFWNSVIFFDFKWEKSCFFSRKDFCP